MGVFRKGFQAMFQRDKWKIFRGDKVMVMVGKDAGQVGTVLKVIRDPRWPRVIVEGQNLNKRHVKRSKDNPGGIVSVEAPLAYSNVALVDPVTARPCRVTWRWLEDGSKVRVSVGREASNSIIPRPEESKQRRKPRSVSSGPSDTPVAAAGEVTHTPGDLPSVLKEALSVMAGQQAQQQREYSTGSGSGASSIVAAAAARVLSGAGRLQPLSRLGWRSFAASSW